MSKSLELYEDRSKDGLTALRDLRDYAVDLEAVVDRLCVERDAAIERCVSPEAYRCYQEETADLIRDLRRRAEAAEARVRELEGAVKCALESGSWDSLMEMTW